MEGLSLSVMPPPRCSRRTYATNPTPETLVNITLLAAPRCAFGQPPKVALSLPSTRRLGPSPSARKMA